MFAMIAGEGGRQADSMEGMARFLGPAGTSQRIWRDEPGACSVAVRNVTLLPEDPSDPQPMVDDRLVFLCRARLDRRSELSGMLQVDSADAAATSDAALLRRAYGRWGADTPQHVYGEYAFVAWERAARRLVAATDHVGNVPLFYRHLGPHLFVSTQLPPLVHAAGQPATLDVRALGLFVANRLGQGWTMFEGIHHLPGGHTLTFQHGQLHTARWWRPDTTPVVRPMQDYVQDTRNLLHTAVTERLRTSGGVATTLSGGLDSTTVTAMAAQQMGERTLHAFTSVPQPGVPLSRRPGWDADDSPWAAAVARQFPNIRHYCVSPGEQDPLDVSAAIHRLHCTPVRNTANLIWIQELAHQAAGLGATVMLNGGFGNLSFSPEGSLEDAPRVSLLRVTHLLRRILHRLHDGNFRRPSLAGSGGEHQERPGASLLLAEFRRTHQADLRTADTYHTVRERLIAAALTPLKVASADTVASLGLEWRDPTSDRRLLEYLLTLPQYAFLAKGRSRGLAREVGKGLLPDVVRLRRTRGAQSPEQASWFTRNADRYRSLARSIETSETCRRFLDIAALTSGLELLCRGGGTEVDAIIMHRALAVGMFVTQFEGNDFWPGASA